MAKKVLIVEDNEHLREILSSVLQSAGYVVEAAATGEQAIEKAISGEPNLILLDLDLPDITGFEAAREIRKNPSTAHIPMIACSALIGWEWREKAFEVGVVDYLEKPISFAVIKAKIEEFILTER
jgi:CheY-like chemotaxis protein